jgi:hypothetical protein
LEDGITFGADQDFFVEQSLHGSDCTSALPYATLGDMTYETTDAPFSTATILLKGAESWQQGENTFCLSVKLMLNMIGSEDLVWQQIDFTFTVMVDYEDGTTTVTYSATDSTEFFGSSTGTGETGNDVGVAPTISAALASQATVFKYGDEIPIAITFDHPLDVFTYDVDSTGVTLVDDVGAPLELGGRAVSTRTLTYTDDFNFATKDIGTLTVTLPLIVFQDATVNTVGVKVPVSWVNSQRTNGNLRKLQSASGTYTGPRSGVATEVVMIQLEPYTDESGAIVGFTITSVVSSVCLGAATLLL